VGLAGPEVEDAVERAPDEEDVRHFNMAVVSVDFKLKTD
jgi:hypothetical protein